MSDMLDRYVDGELPVAVRARTEAHLVACAACRDSVAGLEGLRRLLQRELVEPARAVDLSGLWPAVEARLGSVAVGAEAAGLVDGAAGAAGLAEAVGVQSGSSGRSGAWLPLALASRWPAGLLAAAAAALVLLALALPIASFRVDPVDRAATVASVESGDTASVVLLAGTASQPPVIWVTDATGPAEEDFPL
jgi:anti-sigma factor RsiW